MTVDAETRLTPAQRLTRGLAQTAAGPVDVTRGTLGLVAQSVAATFGGLRQQYRKSKARKEVRRELAEAKQLVAKEFGDVKEAVQTLADTKAGVRARRGTWLLAGAGVAALAGGAALFATIRRSRQPEPSPLLPSVQVEPKP